MLNADHTTSRTPSPPRTHSRAVFAMCLVATLALGACSGEPAPKSSFTHTGEWTQDGFPSTSTVHLTVKPDGTFWYQRTTGLKIEGRVREGQWRTSEGPLKLFPYLPQGGTNHKPFACLRIDPPFLIPLDCATDEPIREARPYVMRSDPILEPGDPMIRVEEGEAFLRDQQQAKQRSALERRLAIRDR